MITEQKGLAPTFKSLASFIKIVTSAFMVTSDAGALAVASARALVMA